MPRDAARPFKSSVAVSTARLNRLLAGGPPGLFRGRQLPSALLANISWQRNYSTQATESELTTRIASRSPPALDQPDDRKPLRGKDLDTQPGMPDLRPGLSVRAICRPDTLLKVVWQGARRRRRLSVIDKRVTFGPAEISRKQKPLGRRVGRVRSGFDPIAWASYMTT